MIPNGACELYYDNSKKLETDSLGTIITGRVLFGDSSGVNDHRIKFGDSGDLQIYHDGSHSYITGSNTGNLKLQANSHIQLSPANGEDGIQVTANGAVELYYDNSKKLETTSWGADVTGILRADELKLQADNHKLYIGAGSDLEIYHDGSNSFINNSTGDLYLDGSSSGSVHFTNSGTGEVMASMTANSSVSLRYDNVVKLNTTSTGIQIDGDGSDADGAKIVLKHLNNNSTDVISSILFSNNVGEAARIQAETIGANNTGVIKFYTDNAGTSAVACTIGSDGTVSDSKGNLRKIPQNYHNAATYTLVASDAGKHVLEATNGATITVPNSVFGAGDAVTIISYQGSGNTTIAQGSGLTLYNAADGATGNRTLAPRGMATIIFVTGSMGYISGAGLS